MHSPIAAADRLALRLLSLAYFVQAVGALSVVGSLEAISAAWALSNAQSALLITVFGVTFALAAPLLQMTLGHLRRRSQVLLGRGQARLGLSEAIAGANGSPGRSFPARKPLLRLDRIYLRGFSVDRAEVHHGATWSKISDHAALSATLRSTNAA